MASRRRLSNRLLAGAGLWLLGVVVACAPRAALPPVTAAADPAEVFAMVRQREDAIHTLRARFSATVHRSENARRAEGVLLVKKPDRFRLRLLSPFGFTIFDYVTSGAHTRMELPLEGKRLVDDEIAAQSFFSAADLRQAFLRGAAAFPGRCTPQANGAEVTVECHAPGDARREVHIARATATVSEEISFTGEAPRVVITFRDYRTVDGVPLPFAIELRAPGRQVAMQIALRSYEINPALADTLFDGADAG
jgi:hypothetical protein